MKPKLPRWVIYDFDQQLRDHCRDGEPLKVSALRKMYEDSIEIKFDTELYGYKDIPDMLKNANVQEFRNLIVEEVQPPSLMKALPDAPPVPVEKVEEKLEDAEIDDIGLEDGDLALNDRTWLFGRHKDNAGEENWVIRWDTSTALRDSNDKQKLFEQ